MEKCSVYVDCEQEAATYKWIESEKAGRDLGESAIRRLAHVSRRRSAKLEPLPTGGDAVDTRP